MSQNQTETVTKTVIPLVVAEAALLFMLSRENAQKISSNCIYQQRKPCNDWTNAISRRHIFHRVCRFVCKRTFIYSASIAVVFQSAVVFLCWHSVLVCNGRFQLFSSGIYFHMLTQSHNCFVFRVNLRQASRIHNFTYANSESRKKTP